MKVLLATDGSEASSNAEWLLSRIPFGEQINLLIAHVEVPPSLAHMRREFPSSVNELLAQYHAHAESLIEKEVSRFEGMSGTVESQLRSGHPADEIIELAEEQNCDLIVIGARGLTPVSRFLMGSTSLSVAKYASCSVLVTRPVESMKMPNHRLRIIVAFDGSESSRQAVEMLATISWGEDVEILILNILSGRLHLKGWGTEFQNALSEKDKKVRKEEIDWAIERLRRATPHVSGEVIEGDSVPEELIDATRRLNADLVVMGQRGMSRVKRFLLGSTCERVLRHVDCSVWIHKEKK